MSRPAERVDSEWRSGGGWARAASVVEFRDEEESALDVRLRLGGGYLAASIVKAGKITLTMVRAAESAKSRWIIAIQIF